MNPNGSSTSFTRTICMACRAALRRFLSDEETRAQREREEEAQILHCIDADCFQELYDEKYTPLV